MSVPHGADIFQPKSESLATLLPEIDQHKAALPNFQREWVWEPEMVRSLVVSVANRYPAGSLLTMPNTHGGDGTFALRPFTGTGSELKTSPTLMVLDGQQRLTSLYQSLYSKNGVKGPNDTTHFVYLDVRELMKFNENDTQDEQTFSDNVFTVQVNRHGQRLRYLSLRESVDITTREQEIEHGVMPLYVVFDPEDLYSWRDAYAERHAEDESRIAYKEKLKEWDREVMPWIQRIRDYRFPVIELNKDMELHAICHIFEKVNSTGVPLTVFELCTAILWARGLKLNDMWVETKERFKRDHILRMQGDLEGAQYLQVISLMSTMDRKRNNPNSRIAVNCRREELLRLKKDIVEDWWPTAAQAYRDASKFMESQGIIAQRVVPYSSMLLPLAAILGYVKRILGSVVFSTSWPKIEQWYWCSVFSQRYSSSVEASAAQDLEQVVSWIKGGNEPDVVRTFNFVADRIQEISNIRNAMYKGILCLLARNGARDMGGEGTLSAGLFYETQQDHHHIFPRAALRNLGINDNRTESIVNKTLISATWNRSISGRRPSEYVSTMKNRLGSDRAEAILRSHLIDVDAMESDNWNDFLLARREELKNLIHSACGGQMQDFSDGLQISVPARIHRLMENVSDVELRLRELIANVLDHKWENVPDHIRPKAEQRMLGLQRDQPGIDPDRFDSMVDKLSFCDLRELEAIMISKQGWTHFSPVFRNKENLSTRFRQLAPLRNDDAHLREPDDLTLTDAEAAVIWFNGAISAVEREANPDDMDHEPLEENETDEIEEVRI